MKYIILLLLSFGYFFPIRSVFAVPPPDFIIQVASQIGTFFTIGIAIISSLYLTAYQYLKFYFGRNKKYFILGGIIVIPISAFIFASVWDYYYQKSENLKENQEWIEQSRANVSREIGKVTENQNNKMFQASGGLEYGILGEEKITHLTIEKTGSSLNITQKQKALTNTSLFISNYDFSVLLQKENPYILDTREDIEYSMGHIPNSIHTRFADLKNGEWENLSSTKTIYVLCSSGMRGKDVTEFLRSKGVSAQYLEKGVKGWVDYGGIWEGEVKFAKIYPEERYSIVYTTPQVKIKQKNGTLIIDARSQSKFLRSKIQNSINIPLLELPTSELDYFFNKVPKHTEVITICDEYINCFIARLVGIELEKRRDVTFLGRYNKPWEY